MRARLPGQHERRRGGLALLAATMPDVRGADLTDLAASPPRAAGRPDMRYQGIGRLLGDERIAVEAVVAPYGREILAHLAANGRTVVPMVDQTRDRTAPGRHGGGTGGWAGLALGSAGRGDRGGDRLSRAARGAGGCGPPSTRGGAAGADGRPLPRQPRADRPVPYAGPGLAAAARAGPLGVWGRGGGHPGGGPRTGGGPPPRRRARPGGGGPESRPGGRDRA